MTDEDKAKESTERKARWDKLSEEEWKKMLQPLRDAWPQWWNNLSNRDKVNKMQYMRTKLSDWFTALSPEEKEEWKHKCTEYWDEINDEKFFEWLEKYRSGLENYYEEKRYPDNGAEATLFDYLKKKGFKFKWQYFNTVKDSEYESKFMNNPVTGGTVSPYHAWDFAIFTPEKTVLVDVDGSIHNLTPGKYFDKKGNDQYEVIKFKESQRPYQTDGLDAYIIKAYDDELADDAEVNYIKGSDKSVYCLKFKELMTILEALNMPKNIFKKLF